MSYQEPTKTKFNVNPINDEPQPSSPSPPSNNTVKFTIHSDFGDIEYEGANDPVIIDQIIDAARYRMLKEKHTKPRTQRRSMCLEEGIFLVMLSMLGLCVFFFMANLFERTTAPSNNPQSSQYSTQYYRR